MNIFLVGMAGSGKTELGKALAIKLNYKFLDTDEEVERLCGKTPAQLITDEGEQALREIEEKIFKTRLHKQGLFVATGGGFPLFHNIMDQLNEKGLTIYLSYDVDVLWQRLQKSHQRPLSQTKEQVSVLLEKRKVIYEKAHITYRGKNDFAENIHEVNTLIEKILTKGKRK